MVKESEKSECRNEKASSTILCPISVTTNGRRPLLVEIKPDLDRGDMALSKKQHEQIPKEIELHGYDIHLTKLKIVIADKAGTSTTSTFVDKARTTATSPFVDKAETAVTSTFVDKDGTTTATTTSTFVDKTGKTTSTFIDKAEIAATSTASTYIDKAGIATTSTSSTFIDQAEIATASTSSTLAFPLSSDSASYQSYYFSSQSEHDSLLSSFSNDSYAANETVENLISHTPIATTNASKKEEHNEITGEIVNCIENMKPSFRESYNRSGTNCTNNISRTKYFQNLTDHGANIIKLNREIELIQHIKKHSKVITLEVDWRRMKQKRLAGKKMHRADREENMQRLYAKSRIEYRMEGKKRREDIAQTSALKLKEWKKGFRARC